MQGKSHLALVVPTGEKRAVATGRRPNAAYRKREHLTETEIAEICFAETRSVGQNSLKDAIEIPRRTRNNPQNISGGSLLPQRFIPLACKPRDLCLAKG